MNWDPEKGRVEDRYSLEIQAGLHVPGLFTVVAQRLSANQSDYVEQELCAPVGLQEV